jgi:hypothetical protein
MGRMRRTTWTLILLLAVSLTAEPLLHTHPLNNLRSDLHASVVNDSGLVCAICATAAARSLPTLPAMAAPLALPLSLPAAPVVKLGQLARTALPSRAPPAG